MLPIPGTSKVAHLVENVAAAGIRLSNDEFAALDAAGRRRRSRAIGLLRRVSARVWSR
jgi:aryl-alcohol dehydrogenase-like predicted oxidoreductase